MKVIFIDHSGFLVELEKCVLLFDYYKGEIPKIEGKKWYVFASHFHEDHFQPKIFDLRKEYPDVTYILSKDIKKYRKKYLQEPYEVVSWNETYEIGELLVQTFHSTDEGCAFYVQAEEKHIYHAGDLHWWHWEGEPDEDNAYMEQAFKKEMALLEELPMDLAFMLLDPRQEQAYDWGMNYFLEHTKAEKVFPMHMWGEFSLCGQYQKTTKGRQYQERFCPIKETGEKFCI